MFGKCQKSAMSTALAAMLLTGFIAHAAPAHAQTELKRIHSSWADVRVKVADGGAVRSMVVAYDSGNAAFNAAALAAVASTKFVPDAHVVGLSTFDYLLMASADGKRFSRILPRLDDARNSSSNVRVRISGDAWLASTPSCNDRVR